MQTRQPNPLDEWWTAVFGGVAALLWGMLCIHRFDVAEPLRPAWLAALPAGLLLAAFSGALAIWLFRARLDLLGPAAPVGRRTLLLVFGLAVLFRLPLAIQGAAGYTSADAALSGLMAVQARDGIANHVFVPSIPYNGSLKAQLTALLCLATGLDAPLAFTLASLAFYALFVAAVFRLGALVARPGRERATALGGGMWAAFAPTFVTSFSLGNDGPYVELLAFGTWALVLGCRFVEDPPARSRLALGIGLLLGLGYWAHILAVIHVVALGLVMLAVGGRALPRLCAWLGTGFALGDLPGLLWNARNEWASFLYLAPAHWLGAAAAPEPAVGPALLARLALLVTGDAWVLFGYDPGYPPMLDALSRGLAALGVLAAVAALTMALRDFAQDRRPAGLLVLPIFVLVNIVTATLALTYIPGIPRYVLFSFGALAPLVARLLDGGPSRLLLALLVAFGALGSLGQARAKLAEAAAYRELVGRLEAEGIRYCVSDFYQSTRITFLSEERIICSSKLGPTTTEYFPEYRPRVDAADDVAIVAINRYSAARMEGKLRELGVRYERFDLMKPVLLRLSRRVDPSELFPGRTFSPR